MEPQRLQSRQGWEWIKTGYALFVKAPLLWIVLLSICLIAAVGISSVPVVGEALVSLLTPAVLVGLMVGCRALGQNEGLELAHLFSGFKRNTSQLVALGGISLVTQFLILGLMMAAGGATLVSILMSGQPQTDPNVMMQALTGAGFAVLIGIVLFSLLMMAMQFAPMLVYFRNVPPLQAMKLSLRAFLHNVGPMLVYGLLLLGFSVLAFMFTALCWSILLPGPVISMLDRLIWLLILITSMLSWLALLTIVFTSLYASYSDIFPAIPEASSIPPASDSNIQNDQSYY